MLKSAGIISQARMTSTRFPGKVLKSIGENCILGLHLQRLKKANIPLVVATTINHEDDAIIDFCNNLSTPTFRGSEHNVLSRFYQAARVQKWDVIVRVTADCPLIDGDMIRKCVDQYLSWNNPWIYYSNCLHRTFPRGFDFEIFSFQALEEAYTKATEDFEIEHVTPYINRNKSGKIILKDWLTAPDLSDYRLTFDEADDFKMLESIIVKFKVADLNYESISKILLQNSELKKINAHVEQKKTESAQITALSTAQMASLTT
ncbi:MAG: cytidylyltransferase domain-containing protein, partial [Pseudobdellovibrionaceae bacterium]